MGQRLARQSCRFARPPKSDGVPFRRIGAAVHGATRIRPLTGSCPGPGFLIDYERLAAASYRLTVSSVSRTKSSVVECANPMVAERDATKLGPVRTMITLTATANPADLAVTFAATVSSPIRTADIGLTV